MHFVVLDTVADSGAEGNVDETQYLWLDAELRAAEARRELVVVFAHHPIASMVQPASGVHLGPGPCTSVPEPIQRLFLRHRGVVAFVVGHQHRNLITPHPRAGDGGFWEIGTSAHIDWPQQSRLLDLTDNADGTLSIFATVFDQGAPAVPGPRPPRRGTLLSAREVEWLASVARELSYNDPQADNGREGTLDGAARAPTGTSSSCYPTPTVKGCKEYVRGPDRSPFRASNSLRTVLRSERDDPAASQARAHEHDAGDPAAKRHSVPGRTEGLRRLQARARREAAPPRRGLAQLVDRPAEDLPGRSLDP